MDPLEKGSSKEQPTSSFIQKNSHTNYKQKEKISSVTKVTEVFHT